MFVVFSSSVTTLYILSFLALKIFIIFLLLIIIRITSPRLKLESILKLGWLVILSLLLFYTIVYLLGVFY